MTEEEEMAADAVMIADLQIIAACGLSYCLSAVADVAMAVADMAMTVACGSSYYSSAAVDSAMVMVDVVLRWMRLWQRLLLVHIFQSVV